MPKKKLLIPIVVVVLAAAAGGGAYAATQAGGDDDHGVLDDAAQRLHVSPQQLTAAFKAAMIDQIDAAVKAGKLTQDQADRLKQQIEQSSGIPFGRHGFRHFGMHGPRFLLRGAASYLGLSQNQLRQRLESGKSLAHIAQAQGKSVTGLEQAITADAKSKLDQAVSSGRITKSQEQRRLDRLSQILPQIVNRTPPAGPPPGPPPFGGPRFHGPAGDAGPAGGDGPSGGDGPPPGDGPPDAPDGAPLPPAA